MDGRCALPRHGESEGHGPRFHGPPRQSRFEAPVRLAFRARRYGGFEGVARGRAQQAFGNPFFRGGQEGAELSFVCWKGIFEYGSASSEVGRETRTEAFY